MLYSYIRSNVTWKLHIFMWLQYRYRFFCCVLFVAWTDRPSVIHRRIIPFGTSFQLWQLFFFFMFIFIASIVIIFTAIINRFEIVKWKTVSLWKKNLFTSLAFFHFAIVLKMLLPLFFK